MSTRANSIQLPDSLTTALSQSMGESALPRWALEALVLEGVREQILSTGEAGEILELGYFQTESFLKERGIEVEITKEEFERDQADLREVIARTRSK